jgi:hypothetical protein
MCLPRDFQKTPRNDTFAPNLDITVWQFTKLLKQIFKIFCKFKLLLQSNCPWKIDNLLLLQ